MPRSVEHVAGTRPGYIWCDNDLCASAAQVCGMLTSPDGAVYRVTYDPEIEASQARLDARTLA
jgi:hypothetical protein